MVVAEGGDAACTFPGPGSSYSLRLAMAPTLPVNVALITDGQTDIPVGGPVSLTSIGGSALVTLFQGHVTISGNVITRASGSELASFINAAFQAAQAIQFRALAPSTSTTPT